MDQSAGIREGEEQPDPVLSIQFLVVLGFTIVGADSALLVCSTAMSMIKLLSMLA